MEEVELVIVGAGPTGLFATFCAGLRAIKSVTLENLDHYGGQMLELYPEKVIYDVQGIPKMVSRDMVEEMYEQSQTFKNQVVLDSNVSDIIPNQDKTFTVNVGDSPKYKAKAVLICSGIGKFTPNKVGAEGEDAYVGKGVFYAVKNSPDFKDKDVIVVGGGDSAFDYAIQIEPFAKSVTIVQHNNVLKAKETSIAAAKSKSKIRIALNTEVKKISGDGNVVRGVTLLDNASKKESNVNVGAVIVAIGHKSDPNSFKSLPLETANRYIRVDTNYRTSVEGVYAAGDVANVAGEPRFALLAIGGAEAYIAINNIKKYLSPDASLFGGHSSSLNI